MAKESMVKAVAKMAKMAKAIAAVAAVKEVGVRRAGKKASMWEKEVRKDMRSSDQPPPLCGRSGCGLR